MLAQETLINGVGIRFAIANWLMAAWAVFFVSCSDEPDEGSALIRQTLQFFLGAEIVILLNVINM